MIRVLAAGGKEKWFKALSPAEQKGYLTEHPYSEHWKSYKPTKADREAFVKDWKRSKDSKPGSRSRKSQAREVSKELWRLASEMPALDVDGLKELPVIKASQEIELGVKQAFNLVYEALPGGPIAWLFSEAAQKPGVTRAISRDLARGIKKGSEKNLEAGIFRRVLNFLVGAKL